MEINIYGGFYITIKIATAECFTHGIIAREIHKCSMGYEGEFAPKYMKPDHDISLLCGLFIPTLTALKSVLNLDPPEPLDLLNNIKVYDEKGDLLVAELMASRVKEISNADIGIGTTAGIGKGAIVILSDKFAIKTTSDVYADLRISDSKLIQKRQISGVKKALTILNDIFD